MRKCLVQHTFFDDSGAVTVRRICAVAICDGRTFPLCDRCLHVFYAHALPSCQFERPAIFAVIRAQEARN